MSRRPSPIFRSFPVTRTLLVAILLLLPLAPLHAADAKPNVVVIFIDDRD